MVDILNSDVTIKRLVLLRRLWGLDQRSIAKAIGVSHRTWQRMEYGDTKITIDVIFKLAEIFHVSPGFFVEDYFPLNLPGGCAACSSFRSLYQENLPENVSAQLTSLIAEGSRELEAVLKESGTHHLPLIDISVESFEMNHAAQKLLSLEKDHYPLGQLFHDKGHWALVFERLMSAPAGKHLILSGMIPEWGDEAPRSFVQMLCLKKRSWGDPRLVSLIMDDLPWQEAILGVGFPIEHRETMEAEGPHVWIRPPLK